MLITTVVPNDKHIKSNNLNQQRRNRYTTYLKLETHTMTIARTDIDFNIRSYVKINLNEKKKGNR